MAIAEPILTPAAGATLTAAGVTLPVLQATAHAVPTIELFGVALGLRADVLMAGFFGSLVAMVLLNSVPATGDTVRELVRTSVRRMAVALASSVTAGYTASLLVLYQGMPDGLLVTSGFVVGVFAQHFLRRVLAPRIGIDAKDAQEEPRG